MFRLQAFLLSILFLLSGSGLSIDLSRCCGDLSGVSLSFYSAEDISKSDCCSKIKAIKPKSCCTDQRIQTVINTVVAKLHSTIDFKQAKLQKDIVIEANRACDLSVTDIAYFKATQYRSQQHPVPILIRKRVLQI